MRRSVESAQSALCTAMPCVSCDHNVTSCNDSIISTLLPSAPFVSRSSTFMMCAVAASVAAAMAVTCLPETRTAAMRVGIDSSTHSSTPIAAGLDDEKASLLGAPQQKVPNGDSIADHEAAPR